MNLVQAGMMGCCFSLAQWQELELQTLIFKHMLAGAAVPPELLHLVKKSVVSSDVSLPYYVCNPLHQYYPHYQSALVQSGYWGRAAMDPEPGRCRRTDGKKWRCSRDVVAGQKYCERHMHRGRNRSRKHVENNPTTTTTAGATTGAAVGSPHFRLSSPSTDLLHLNQRSLESMIETKCPFEGQIDGSDQISGDRTLRHFFDDWPRSVHETNDKLVASATSLSISMPGNSTPSDFSLKLGTGDGGEPHGLTSERERPQLNWGTAWEPNGASPLGGPLAEALRSSASASTSPTRSQLHQLQ